MQIPKDNQATSHKWAVTVIVAIGSYMSTLDAGIVRVALPHLGEVFQVDPNTVAWLMLTYLLIGTGLMLTLGQVGDIFSRKKLYTLGLLIFSIGLGLSAFSGNFIQLLIFRAIQSVGSAMIIANAYAILTASSPVSERGKVLGIMGAVVGAGLLSGPVLGGILIQIADWPAIFYIRAPIAFIATVLSWIFLKETPTQKRAAKFDLVGAISIFAIMSCLLFAVNRGQSIGWTSPLVIGLAIGSIAFAFLFIFTERRVAQPVVDLSLFRSRFFTSASLSHVMHYVGEAAMTFLLPFYLMQGLSFSPSKSGLVIMTIYAAYLLVSPFAGRLSDRVGTRSLCALGLAILSVGIILMRRADVNISTIDIIWHLAIIGIGSGLFVTPNTSAIMGYVPKERLGTASGMQATLRQIGMSIGTAIASTVFTATQLSYSTQLTNQGLPKGVVESLSTIGGFYSTIIVVMAFPVLGTIIAALRGKQNIPNDK